MSRPNDILFVRSRELSEVGPFSIPSEVVGDPHREAGVAHQRAVLARFSMRLQARVFWHIDRLFDYGVPGYLKAPCGCLC